jgi:hypothetical protein
MAGSVFVARKKNKIRIVFCGQIVPVYISISKHGQLGASERGLVVPEEADIVDCSEETGFVRFVRHCDTKILSRRWRWCHGAVFGHWCWCCVKIASS